MMLGYAKCIKNGDHKKKKLRVVNWNLADGNTLTILSVLS